MTFAYAHLLTSGGESAMHIERIHKNSEFWNNCVEKANWFFRTCFLPELMGSWLTRPFVVDSSEGHSAQASEGLNSQTDIRDTAVCQSSNSQLDTPPTYCYCGGPEFGRMLACDNKDCSIEWFHIECLELEESI